MVGYLCVELLGGWLVVYVLAFIRRLAGDWFCDWLVTMLGSFVVGYLFKWIII